MYKPQLYNPETNTEIITRFKGYDKNFVIDENAFSYMENMSGDSYPVLSPRKKRLFFDVEGENLQCLASKERVVYINDGKLYYGGKHVTKLTFPDDDVERKFVSMGSKFLVFPDKVYFNTEDSEDYGSLEARFNNDDGATCVMCTADGELYGDYSISANMPENAENGDLWLDTSREVHILKQYSSAEGMWVSLAETYIRINCSGIGESFNTYDGVYLTGFNSIGITGQHIIRDKGDDYIVITGMLDKETVIETPVAVRRLLPEMDFICESGNRIWGCSSKHNEIYASKLGDPTNFYVFMGVSTDSYAASVGTDGNFTGAVSFRGYVLFFKENCVHKIYGQNPPYTITTSFIRGVQKGSHRSLVCLNETLYYKSPTGICAYEGGVPVCISSDFGGEYYTDAVAGTCADKYYICMTNKDGERGLFVYDEDKSLWHREDNTDIREFASNNNNLYFIMNCDGINKLGIVDGENQYGSFTGELINKKSEEEFTWCAESGIWGLYLPENKYYSNVIIRASGSKGARLRVYFEFDSSNVWLKQMDKIIDKTGSFMLPFITPRCDHMRIKLEGTGDVKIYSISRKIETGSELSV